MRAPAIANFASLTRLRQRLRQLLRDLLVRPEPPAVVDTHEVLRKRAIAEAEWQAQADEQSRVLRVSGKVPAVASRITAVTVVERVRVETKSS